uniref:Uncharacterized protein n=1 Tax=Geospiza parvula TaxID=87175 RepID=A0A8U8BMZ0_GEOPR
MSSGRSAAPSPPPGPLPGPPPRRRRRAPPPPGPPPPTPGSPRSAAAAAAVPGSNDVFVTSRSDFRAQLRRCQRLLAPGGGPGGPGELRLHGLGLAVPRTINLALQLQAGAGGALRLHASTSSVPLRDHRRRERHRESAPGAPRQRRQRRRRRGRPPAQLGHPHPALQGGALRLRGSPKSPRNTNGTGHGHRDPAGAPKPPRGHQEPARTWGHRDAPEGCVHEATTACRDALGTWTMPPARGHQAATNGSGAPRVGPPWCHPEPSMSPQTIDVTLSSWCHPEPLVSPQTISVTPSPWCHPEPSMSPRAHGVTPNPRCHPEALL